MAAGRLVGTPVARFEDKRLLLGQARFVADITVPRTLHMAIVRSTKAHAVIKGIDTSRAGAVSGVRRVVTGADIVEAIAPLPSIDLAGGGLVACYRALAAGKVRHVGEPVAAVFADDPFQAADAAALLDVAYRDLPVILDTEAAASATPPTPSPATSRCTSPSFAAAVTVARVASFTAPPSCSTRTSATLMPPLPMP